MLPYQTHPKVTLNPRYSYIQIIDGAFKPGKENSWREIRHWWVPRLLWPDELNSSIKPWKDTPGLDPALYPVFLQQRPGGELPPIYVQLG